LRSHNWVEQVDLRDVIETLADDFTAVLAGGSRLDENNQVLIEHVPLDVALVVAIRLPCSLHIVRAPTFVIRPILPVR
jgi:hypothetical protein